MSNYSHALQTLINENFDGKQINLASHCGLPQPSISRHCSGQNRPDRETLERICASLPAAQCDRLAIAHLNDETPPAARDRVISVTRAYESTPSDNLVFHDAPNPLPHTYLRLDAKTRQAFDTLMALALDNSDARDAVQSTAKVITGE